MTKYNMISVPDGSGSSTKDGNIKDDLFYVSQGAYGGIKCTLVIFNNSDLQFCFEDIISFKDEAEVLKEILEHDINNFYKIVESVKSSSYNDGYYNGKKDIKQSLQNLIFN